MVHPTPVMNREPCGTRHRVAGAVLAAWGLVCAAGLAPRTAAAEALSEDVAVAPKALAFGEVAVGSNAERTVTLTNLTDGPASLIAMTLAGPGAEAYSTNSNCAPRLESAASCTITVSLRPTASVPYTANLLVATGARLASIVVALSGKGVAPVGASLLSVTPSSVRFDGPCTQAEGLQVVVIANAGRIPIILQGFSYTGGEQFSFSHRCPDPRGALAAGQACQLLIRFRPKSPGTVRASLAIASSAGRRDVTLTGSCRPVTDGA